jgi:hypothetical protein
MQNLNSEQKAINLERMKGVVTRHLNFHSLMVEQYFKMYPFDKKSVVSSFRVKNIKFDLEIEYAA